MFEEADDILIGISEAATRWTSVSIMCYERHCRCDGCYYRNYFESGNCLCKYVVMCLVRKFGKPTKDGDNSE